jgi:uncharacterized protein (UPF0297 family)
MSLSPDEHAARNRISFFFGRPIAFHRCFVTLTGSVHAALMLSQALYWLNPERQGQNRGKDDGWFWKSREEWEAELGLSRWEQETARRQLRSMAFWREKQRCLEHRIYFGIDFVALEKALAASARSRSVEVSSPLPEGGDPTAGEGGIPSAGGRGTPPSAKAEKHPSTAGEKPPSPARPGLRRKEHRLLQRLPEITSSSELSTGLHRIMPNAAWDDDAVRALWSECRTREPDCTTDLILQKVTEKLTRKGWNRIHNPVGFLLVSVPRAIEASSNATKLCIQDRAEHERALAQNEAELLLEHEREMEAWETAEQAFEAL